MTALTGDVVCTTCTSMWGDNEYVGLVRDLLYRHVQLLSSWQENTRTSVYRAVITDDDVDDGISHKRK